MWDDIPEPSDTDVPPPDTERVLVVVVARPRDWELVRDEHWYRIPIARAPKRIGAEYLAFYHTKRAGALRWQIAYYAPILRYRIVPRRELLPEEHDHPRADMLYYKIELGPLEALPRPIPSQKLRRVTFIMTTLPRLLRANEINDLWEPRNARDHLWRALRKEGIPTRRQVTIKENGLDYCADLAIYCARRNLAIRCADIAEGFEQSFLNDVGSDWIWQRFRVGEIMGDVAPCVKAVRRFVEANGGPSAARS